MTLIAVFNDSHSTHLISDSLITCIVDKDVASPVGQYLSTGIYLDGNEQLRYKYTEGVLKIWEIQDNLAIGLAGEVSLATNFLELIVNQSRIKQFRSFHELVEYVEKYAFPSIVPFKGSCELCGFLGESTVTTKFVFAISDNNGLKIRKSSDPHDICVVGSGSGDFTSIISRLPKDQLLGGFDPTLIFSIFAEHLYMNQFIGMRDMITQRYIGGAIAGIYHSNNRMTWQPSRSVVIFANVGGTGFDAKFEWLPIAYKTWYERGSFFSMSMFEQSGHYYQRLTQYSNLLSESWEINENNLTPEMRTFNAHQLSVILLPKGISNEFPAALRASGKIQPFEEISEKGRIVGLRLNREFFKQFEGRFFVADDYKVKIGIQRYPPLIKALRRRVDSLNREQDPTEWIHKQAELAVRLTTYGGNTKNLDLLSEALSRFLHAYEASKEYRPGLIKEAMHNLKQFIHDINSNLAPEEVAVVIERNKRSYWKYLDTVGANENARGNITEDPFPNKTSAKIIFDSDNSRFVPISSQNTQVAGKTALILLQIRIVGTGERDAQIADITTSVYYKGKWIPGARMHPKVHEETDSKGISKKYVYLKHKRDADTSVVTHMAWKEFEPGQYALGYGESTAFSFACHYDIPGEDRYAITKLRVRICDYLGNSYQTFVRTDLMMLENLDEVVLLAD